MSEEQVQTLWGCYEPVSCWTHLLAMPVFAVLGYRLLRRGRGSVGRSAGLFVLVISTLWLLAMSAVYHMLAPGTARSVMRQLDISAVFALIAGTVTPVHVVLFRGIQRWLPLLLIWSVAVVGIVVRILYRERLPFGVGNGIFLVMGWGGLISCVVLARRYGYPFVRPLVWGGIAYTVGVLILGSHWPNPIPGVVTSHELWHLAVLVGLSLHWRFVFQFADGLPHASRKKNGADDTEKRARAIHPVTRQGPESSPHVTRVRRNLRAAKR